MAKMEFYKGKNQEVPKEEKTEIEKEVEEYWSEIKSKKMLEIRDKINKLPTTVGNKVLISGKSGTGKSTLMKLLIKNYSCTSGNIYIDNMDIKEVKNNELRKNIIYINHSIGGSFIYFFCEYLFQFDHHVNLYLKIFLVQ